jgi:hypothetical protein
MKSIQRCVINWIAWGLGASLMTSCTWDKVEPDVCFESDVLPVFTTYCSSTGCHNATDRVKGYDLTNYAGIMEGIRPKSILSSELVSVLSENGDDHMPPAGYPQPSDGQIASIKAWVKSGAANTTNCSTVSCDTSAAVSYSGDLQPLLGTYCNGCHGGGSPSAGLDLNDYSTVKSVAENGRLQGAMRGSYPYIAMPPTGNLLPACSVDQIDKWVAAGTPNN